MKFASTVIVSSRFYCNLKHIRKRTISCPPFLLIRQVVALLSSKVQVDSWPQWLQTKLNDNHILGLSFTRTLNKSRWAIFVCFLSQNGTKCLEWTTGSKLPMGELSEFRNIFNALKSAVSLTICVNVFSEKWGVLRLHWLLDRGGLLEIFAKNRRKISTKQKSG